MQRQRTRSVALAPTVTSRRVAPTTLTRSTTVATRCSTRVTPRHAPLQHNMHILSLLVAVYCRMSMTLSSHRWSLMPSL